MGVISVPPGLRLSTTLFLFSVPMAAMETIIASRAPWWRLPYDKVALWSLAVALICYPQSAWLARGRSWAISLTTGFALLWCALSVWYSLKTRNPALGFFTLFLALFLGGVITWMRRELHRSYFDPAMTWYQGLPRAIPGLECELVHGDHIEPFRVARMDRDGAFVFQRGEAKAVPRSEVELRFRFRGREVRCPARAVRLLEREQGAGAGLRFKNLTSDARKEVGDFVEILRGEGYVS